MVGGGGFVQRLKYLICVDLCRRQPFDGYSIIFYDFLRSDNCIIWFNMFSMVFSMAFLCFFYGLSMVFLWFIFMISIWFSTIFCGFFIFFHNLYDFSLVYYG